MPTTLAKAAWDEIRTHLRVMLPIVGELGCTPVQYRLEGFRISHKFPRTPEYITSCQAGTDGQHDNIGFSHFLQQICEGRGHAALILAVLVDIFQVQTLEIPSEGRNLHKELENAVHVACIAQVVEAKGSHTDKKVSEG
jgi:hypothetical protein